MFVESIKILSSMCKDFKDSMYQNWGKWNLTFQWVVFRLWDPIGVYLIRLIITTTRWKMEKEWLACPFCKHVPFDMNLCPVPGTLQKTFMLFIFWGNIDCIDQQKHTSSPRLVPKVGTQVFLIPNQSSDCPAPQGQDLGPFSQTLWGHSGREPGNTSAIFRLPRQRCPDGLLSGAAGDRPS